MVGFACYLFFIAVHLAEHTNLERDRGASVAGDDTRTSAEHPLRVDVALDPIVSVPKVEGDGTIHDAGVMEEPELYEADMNDVATREAESLRKKAERIAREEAARRADNERLASEATERAERRNGRWRWPKLRGERRRRSSQKRRPPLPRLRQLQPNKQRRQRRQRRQ